MTCIVGIIDKRLNKILLGGDSAGIEKENLELRVRNDPKVFINKEFVIGYTTSFRMGQLLMYSTLPSFKDTITGDHFKFMVEQFVPAVRKIFIEGGYMCIKNNKEEGGIFIVGFNGKLFIVYKDFQVAEFEEDYVAVGCGAPFALGYLFRESNEKTNNALVGALKAAENYSGGVRAPFTIVELTY